METAQVSESNPPPPGSPQPPEPGPTPAPELAVKGECSHPFSHFIKGCRGSSLPKGNIPHLQELCGEISYPALAPLPAPLPMPKLGPWEKLQGAELSEMAPGGMEPLESPAAWGLAGCPQPLEGCKNPERMSTLTPCVSQLCQGDVWVCTLTLIINVGKQVLHMSQRPINVKLLRLQLRASRGREEEGYHPASTHTPPRPLSTEKEKIAAA